MLSSIPSSKLEWYQTDDTVTITIKLKGIDPNNGIENMQFTEGSVKGVINHINKGKVDTYNIDIKLWGPIEYNNAKYDITPYKVELYLPKKDKLTQWPSLEKDNTIINKPPQAETAAAASSSYPSSSKVRKDWSKIDKICDDELKGEKENGDAALNELFRKIYKDADDDTRRAMIKSFQTSGGTVLSTNWDEVGKADYEGKDRPDAPDGQEWRKW
ncbi:Suppressor of G2 allele of SKP1 [Perkinsus chesapeaki]|uniref:Suppressor of G2 allele of SKP1 n=2 Tax=Alveolata TaxID=33630 RepID=A0A7J6MP24_PERCH|nr:Suppressor of G2 allele of SKP1 [Perkinsus chesapeaki]